MSKNVSVQIYHYNWPAVACHLFSASFFFLSSYSLCSIHISIKLVQHRVLVSLYVTNHRVPGRGDGIPGPLHDFITSVPPLCVAGLGSSGLEHVRSVHCSQMDAA